MDACEAETANVTARAKKDINDAKQYGIRNLPPMSSWPPKTSVVDWTVFLSRGRNLVLSHNRMTGYRGGAVLRDDARSQRDNGIKRHGPTGSVFHAGSQQAMAERETSADPPGAVLRVLTSTWPPNGRLLRLAMVIVAKSPTTDLAPERARPHVAAPWPELKQ